MNNTFIEHNISIISLKSLFFSLNHKVKLWSLPLLSIIIEGLKAVTSRGGQGPYVYSLFARLHKEEIHPLMLTEYDINIWIVYGK